MERICAGLGVEAGTAGVEAAVVVVAKVKVEEGTHGPGACETATSVVGARCDSVVVSGAAVAAMAVGSAETDSDVVAVAGTTSTIGAAA